VSILQVNYNEGFTFEYYFDLMFEYSRPTQLIFRQSSPNAPIIVSTKNIGEGSTLRDYLQLDGSNLILGSSGTPIGTIESIDFSFFTLGKMAELEGAGINAKVLTEVLQGMIQDHPTDGRYLEALLQSGVTQTTYTAKHDNAVVNYWSTVPEYFLGRGDDQLEIEHYIAEGTIVNGGQGTDTVYFRTGSGRDQPRVDVVFTDTELKISALPSATFRSFESVTLQNTRSLILGNSDDNTIRAVGYDGRHTIYGGAGNDHLVGENGQQTIYGGAGNDLVECNFDRDVVFGGSGKDTLTLPWSNQPSGPGRVTVNLDESTLDFRFGPFVRINGFENFDATGYRDYFIIGSRMDNSLEGGTGSDSINGGSGRDYIDGDFGNDLLIGGLGADTFSFVPEDFGSAAPKFGRDIIEDFDLRQDKIRLELGRRFDTVEEVLAVMEPYSNGVRFVFSDIGTILLTGITPLQALNIDVQFS
jgi:Ca2+-binding RTX toxin-like protein